MGTAEAAAQALTQLESHITTTQAAHRRWLTCGALKQRRLLQPPMAHEQSPYSLPGLLECCRPRLWPSSWKGVSRE